MSVDIAYIVSHGFAARMVMQTNLLGLLVKQGFKVALISPDIQGENLMEYCGRNGVSLYQFAPSSNFWTKNHKKSRIYFLEDIDKNPALLEKYKYALKNESLIGKIRVSILKLLHNLKFYIPGIKAYYKKREEKYLKNNSANELIFKIQPKCIISTYPVNFMEAMLIKAAKEYGSKTIMHILSWDNITSKGAFPVLCDNYIVWGDIMKKELLEYYNIRKESIYIAGVPHFDLHFEKRPIPVQTKKVIFFAMSAERFVPNEIDIVEYLAKKVIDGRFGEDTIFIVRPHPQNVQGNMTNVSWIKRLEKMNKLGVIVDFPDIVESELPWSMKLSDMYGLSDLLRSSSICINSGSTITIEAMGLDIPVIITAYDGEENLEYWFSARRHLDSVHLKKLYKMNGASIAKSNDQLCKIIDNYLVNPSYLKEERKKSFETECYKPDGKSTERTIQILLEIC